MAENGVFQLEYPHSYSVHQRDNRGYADIPVKLQISQGEKRQLSMQCHLRPLGEKEAVGEYTISLQVDGNSCEGVFQGVLAGDYSLEVVAYSNGGEAVYRDRRNGIGVGDVYLLAGQSNMEGVGKLIGTERPSPWVRCFYLNDQWGIANDPLCWFNEASDPVHWKVPEGQKEDAARQERFFREFGAGLGISFGKAMKEYSKVPIGLLMCAHGGTDMEQWDPAGLSDGGQSFYGSMFRRVSAVGGKVRACLWYQGESDAADWKKAAEYKQRFISFIEALRRDSGQPELPIFYAQLNTWLGEGDVFPVWNGIQLDQIHMESELSHVALVSTIDLSLSDAIHLSTPALKKLGNRFALLARRLCFQDAAYERGPRVRCCSFADRERTTLRIEFEHVNGGLRPGKDIRGFRIEHEGAALPVMDCRLDRANSNTVIVKLRESAPDRVELWYGKGFNPVCNLRDGADLAVPVFRYSISL
ncbi:sialate O-acetylesterase [Paenibacillus sp. J5C_2022]|uniref:sialate O-acetylesterase n=1 Tax=Paenibacillus sp. J5C2022 TaxID=2977129 RepID=UPI0021D24387|nr:sialate O-acetylesterase [Paenibacillus sp. J5C2022]MCU6709667.1 sialate O-acetylesterase [Paenibacillus sp. J5C2022]